MANYGGEIASLDFSNLIGGPLTAVINAQAQAAKSTIDFISSVGFDEERNPIYVKFKYPKQTQSYVPAVYENGTKKSDEIPAKIEVMELEVPLLTIVPIPFIRVDEATIDFNAKINAVDTKDQNSSMNFGANLEVKQKWPGGSAKLKASFSYQKTTATGSKVDRTYSMSIHIRAVQDDMPAGMERMLSILESSMLEKKSET